MRTLAPLLASTLLLLAPPARADTPDWSCPAALRTSCEAGRPCSRAEVTPFTLLLIASQGEVEYCEGEHCEYGRFTPAAADGPLDANRSLRFGWATLEPSPLPAAYVGRAFAVTVDFAAATVTLMRASADGLEILQASACVPWP